MFRARFGLFSQPVSTAIGDTNTFQAKKNYKDEDGNVITAPRNFYTNKLKKGNNDNILFSKPTYNAIGNPFKEAGMSAMRTMVKDAYTRGGHDRDFRPTKNPQEKLHKATYEYKCDPPSKDKKNYRDEDGKVITQPRGFLNNPVKKGQVGKGVFLGEKLEYKPEEYGYAKKIEDKEREEHYQNIEKIGGGKHWCPRAKHTDTFNKPRQVYEENPPIPRKKTPPKEEPKGDPLHDKAFKPANPGRKGIQGMISKFPAHVPDPPVEKKRVVYAEGEEPESPPGFKATYRFRSSPSPSVATNFRNLKASFPSAFKR